MSSMADQNVLIEFHDVVKSYDGKGLVIKELNLQVHRGEFLSLLGPSGSGKTTALMMLAGFEQPTSGRILIEGEDITRKPPHRRGMGVVFQSYALFPTMSISQNLAYPLELRGVSGQALVDRVNRALSMVKLVPQADRLPGQLSGGQQQRAALARALIFEPKVVLMDEPLGALDKALREELQFEIRQLHRALGMTFVYVTHDQNEALTMSDRIAVFGDGVIRQIGAPQSLYDRPASLFVARFMGEMNTLECRVEHVGSRACTVQVAQEISFSGIPMQSLKERGPAVLCIRPSAIKIGSLAEPSSIGESQVNTCVAQVVDLEFLGDRWRVHLRLSDGQAVKAHVLRGAQLPSIGQPLLISVESESCLIFPADRD